MSLSAQSGRWWILVRDGSVANDPTDPTATLAAPNGSALDAGSSPYQSSAPGNSPYFTGHDAPHLGQTVGLNSVGNLLGIVGVALVDRRYDLFLTRRLELIPDCLEVGRHLGVGAGHAGKHGIKLDACRLHLRVERILRGLVLGVHHRIQCATRVYESHAGVTRRVSPSGWDERQSKGEHCRHSDRLRSCHR